MFFDWWGLGSTVADAYRATRPGTISRQGREGDRRVAGMIGMALGDVLVPVVLVLWIVDVVATSITSRQCQQQNTATVAREPDREHSLQAT
jgi:hypothetical protein